MDKSALEALLKARFEKNRPRHQDINWEEVMTRLASRPKDWKVIDAMEESGGEPDVVDRDPATGALLFMDCSEESPTGRRSLCFDQAALEDRKANKPSGSALGQATDFGAEVLNEEDYRYLQTLGEFDRKTSSWIATPAEVRALGGALFGDRRYGRVFTYHNGADSYYAARGWRGKVWV